MTPLLGFMPDAIPTTPGVITSCTNLIPDERAMVGAPSPVAIAGVGALGSEVKGAAVVTRLDGTRRVLAGTLGQMYELIGSTWLDVSRPGAYSGSTDTRWSITQFGNTTIASNDTQVIQASQSGAFADISSAPQARIVVGIGDFVIAFNTTDGTFGDAGDRWWCCAFRDHTSWTPSVTTQATTGRLVGSGGQISAAIALGANPVAFKPRAMFLGTYVGSPIVWQWDQVPGGIGCVGPEAVCEFDGTLYFRSEDDFYVYDGTRPIPIGEDIRKWMRTESSAVYAYRTRAVLERGASRIWFFFPSAASSGATDRAVVYHVPTRRWGVADMTTEAAMVFITPGLTMNAAQGTFNAQPNIPIDSPFWLAGNVTFSIFDTNHQLVAMAGTSISSSLVTGDMGDDDRSSLVRRVRLRFTQQPSTAAMQGYVRATAAGTLAAAAAAQIADAGFDVRQDARWHRFSFAFTGPVAVNAIRLDATPTGTR